GHRVCLLESVEGPARLARYSFVGLDPCARFRSARGECLLADERGEQRLEGPVQAALRRAARSEKRAAPRGLPPFVGRWIGWTPDQWSASLEPSVPGARRDPWGVPEASFDLYQDLLAFDHASQRITFVTRCESPARLGAAHERLSRIAADALAPLDE